MRGASGGLVLAALVALAAAVRLIGLGQYPQAHPDEGFWAAGSRNFVLHGDGLLDGRLHPLLSPATFALLAVPFAAVGPGLVTARAFSAVLAALTCLLLAGIARRDSPERPWLPVLLFALSSLALLVGRMILLEAHQTFWLLLTAACWLSGRRRPLAAGLAFAAALLVKSNSLYLLPAFLLTPPPAEPGRPRWRPAALFLLAAAGAAGGVYLALAARWPVEFRHAFAYELDGARLAGDGALFHVGRFGLHPARMAETAGQLLVTDGLLFLGGLAGLARAAAGWRGASRAERFFALWLGLGLAFLLGQVYVEHRYFTTLTPALAFLAARAVGPLLARGGAARAAAVVLLAAFCLPPLARLGAGVWRRPNGGYWRLVAWMRREVPPDRRVLASPVINLSLPQQGYDFFRAVVPYGGGPHRPLGEVVAARGVSHILVDDEWREYETPEMADFLKRHCRHVATVGGVGVYEVGGGR